MYFKLLKQLLYLQSFILKSRRKTKNFRNKFYDSIVG